MKTQTISIEGMTCDHCVMHVKNELSKIASVKDIRIGKAIVEVDEAATSPEDLSKAVDAAGYKVTSIA